MKIDDLDNMLNYLKEKHDYTKFIQIVKDKPELDCDAIIIKLEKDGYINSGKSIDKKITGTFDVFTKEVLSSKEKIVSEDNIYRLSFEGFTFLESPYFILKKRPYRYKQTTETIKAIYNLAKTIVLVLNAVAILVLMYLAIEWKSFF
ncbi:MAG: hypothetical protein IPK31_16930 [Chitinophagaceae bacterium]|nr:hypothetical protein [Chitinophagaceae bacterium]